MKMTPEKLDEIAKLDCGKVDPQWIDFVSMSPQDAWQLAFSAGLMAAITWIEDND